MATVICGPNGDNPNCRSIKSFLDGLCDAYGTDLVGKATCQQYTVHFPDMVELLSLLDYAGSSGYSQVCSRIVQNIPDPNVYGDKIISAFKEGQRKKQFSNIRSFMQQFGYTLYTYISQVVVPPPDFNTRKSSFNATVTTPFFPVMIHNSTNSVYETKVSANQVLARFMAPVFAGYLLALICDNMWYNASVHSRSSIDSLVNDITSLIERERTDLTQASTNQNIFKISRTNAMLSNDLYKTSVNVQRMQGFFNSLNVDTLTKRRLSQRTRTIMIVVLVLCLMLVMATGLMLMGVYTRLLPQSYVTWLQGTVGVGIIALLIAELIIIVFKFIRIA